MRSIEKNMASLGYKGKFQSRLLQNAVTKSYRTQTPFAITKFMFLRTEVLTQVYN